MFGKGFRFYIVLSVLFALAAVGFLWGGRHVDAGYWPMLSGTLAMLSALRASTLAPVGRRMLALTLANLPVLVILFMGGAVVHALPPVLVTERFTVTTTESWTPSREELAVALDQMRHHIETTEDGCELLAVDDPATGTTTVRLLSHGRCSFALRRRPLEHNQ